jgi:hypothetical protein
VVRSRGSTSPEVSRAINRRNESFAAKLLQVKSVQLPPFNRFSAVKSPGWVATIDRSEPFDFDVFAAVADAPGGLATAADGECDV